MKKEINFKAHTSFEPAGDQPQAIKELSESILKGNRYQTLEGVTGSGKTYTMAKVIENVKMPTIIMTHNKTLAAQLYSEFRGLGLFDNAFGSFLTAKFRMLTLDFYNTFFKKLFYLFFWYWLTI